MVRQSSEEGTLGAKGHQTGALLQRQCACGTHTIAGGECDACRQKQKADFLQRYPTFPALDDISLNNPLEAPSSFPQSNFASDFSHIPAHTHVDPSGPAHFGFNPVWSHVSQQMSRMMVARQSAAPGPASQSLAERIVNMHSLLEGSILGDAPTYMLQANTILRECCQPRNRHVSYITIDSTGGPRVRPMLTLTPQQRALRFPAPENGRAPLMFDPSFFDGLTVASFEERVHDVQNALEELVRWRFDQFAIDAQDLQDEYVANRLRDMRATDAGTRELRQYQQHTADTAVRDHIDQLLSYSTAIPHGATVGAASTTLQIGTTDVTILPDTRGGTRNHTEFSPDPLNIHISATTQNGQVTSFSGVPSTFRITIQTTYATTTGDPETLTSTYGRGQTPDDQAAGNTSLRFHEGRHGADYIEYLQTNSRPQFTGTVGMSVSAAQVAITAYLNQHRNWLRAMDRFSIRRTDCVGPVTIDQAHAGQVGYQLQCTP